MLVDYYYLTGDSTWNEMVITGLQFQVGTNDDFMPSNETTSEGNDDQGFWALASMSATEQVFPNPPAGDPGWLALTQAVYNEYVSRWDKQFCDGGLRWQIHSFNQGWTYKNSIANGCFFNIAARLSRYTGNQTYAKWAEKVFDWEEQIGLITPAYTVYDGVSLPTSPSTNCTDIDPIEWTYNVSIYLYGAAVMYNTTESAEWKTRTEGLLKSMIGRFVKNGVVYENDCESNKNCNLDEQSFKGYAVRFMAQTMQLAPFTASTIYPILQTTAQAAAGCCIGSSSGFPGTQGEACGFSWLTPGTFDGFTGVGEQMNSLAAVMYTLIPQAKGAVTQHTGGTSKGNVNAGNTNVNNGLPNYSPITGGDRFGAALITIMLLSGLIAMCFFCLR